MAASSHGEYLDKNTGESTWWTNIFSKLAYNIVKDHKFPILIPSYNNPNPPAVTGFLSKMTADKNYPIIIFVRDSQKQQYIDANTHPYATIVSMQDNLINSAGKARKWSLKWLYTHGYSHAFSFDDDALGIAMTEQGLTGSGELKSQHIKNIDNVSDILASWQIAVETLEMSYPNTAITGIYPTGFGWKAEYCWSDESALLYRGNINQLVCLNVKVLLENGITYNDNKECGHEDIDLILQCLQKNLIVATFPFINYSVPPMDIANFSSFGSTLDERMKTQQDLMRNKWGDYEYVTYRDKRGHAQVVPNFRKYRKDHEFEDKKIFDIWNNINNPIQCIYKV